MIRGFLSACLLLLALMCALPAQAAGTGVKALEKAHLNLNKGNLGQKKAKINRKNKGARRNKAKLKRKNGGLRRNKTKPNGKNGTLRQNKVKVGFGREKHNRNLRKLRRKNARVSLQRTKFNLDGAKKGQNKKLRQKKKGRNKANFRRNRPNSVKLIARDMHKKHVAKLHGVPKHFDWYKGPRVGMGLDPKGFTAMNAWGQVYEAAGGNPSTNSRVQLRKIKAFYLSKSDGKWHKLQATRSVEGDAYTEGFGNNSSHKADERRENGGGISVTVGNGMNYHFWPKSDRVALPPAKDIAGIFTTVQARLVLNDPKKRDDRIKSRILVGMGGDYWRDKNAQWAPNYVNNNDIAIGRHRFVKTGWRSFNMTTLSRKALRRTPPPLK